MPYLTFAAMYLLSTFWQKIIQWDQDLLIKLNSKWTNPFFDSIMPLFRNSVFWIPLYLFIFVLILVNFGRRSYWWIVLFVATVELTDTIGTKLFKYGFERMRPCNNPDILPHLRVLVRCPSGYGFISNHAANHFGMAMFLFLTLHRYFKNWMLLAFLWAGIICYAQVYVGVHYPSDIAGGMIVGGIFGTLTGLLFNKFFSLDPPGQSRV